MVFDPVFICVLLIGALIGGFVAGLAGFGAALILSGVWLHFIDPITAAPLMAACSVTGQLTSFKASWKQMNWQVARPFLIGAAIGVPLGSLSLDYLPADSIKIGAGIILVTYAGYFLLVRTPPRLAIDNRFADGFVGSIGGFLGGLAAISGPPAVIWCQLRGFGKALQRSVYQPYNTSILASAVIAHGIAGRLTSDVAIAYAVSMPAVMIGALIGARVFHLVDEKLFLRIVLVLLMCSGLGLLLRNLTSL